MNAANGRQVPAGVGERYQNERTPQVVGRDSRGQEYAVSRGSAGVCLIGIRGPSQPGFEGCSPFDEDLVGTTYLGNGRVRTVVLQAGSSSTPRQMASGDRIAPGLWVSESTGELSGG